MTYLYQHKLHKIYMYAKFNKINWTSDKLVSLVTIQGNEQCFLAIGCNYLVSQSVHDLLVRYDM